LLLTAKDLIYCTGYLATCVAPPQLDAWFVERCLPLWVRCRRRKIERLGEEMTRLLGANLNGRDPRHLAERRVHLALEENWGQLRALGPRRWKPQVAVDGVEHVRQALTAGRGVVLWGTAIGSGLVHKIGLWGAGVKLVHLSSSRHGAVSGSRLALRVLAPLRWRSEIPYLAERVVIQPNGSLGYLRRLEDWLRQNGCVSIMGEHQGRQNVEAPLLAETRSFATGAPSLAWRQGSALLTVYATREGPFRYRVVVEPPIDADRSLDRKRFAEAAVREFAARLSRRLAEHPADWEGWKHGGI